MYLLVDWYTTILNSYQFIFQTAANSAQSLPMVKLKNAPKFAYAAHSKLGTWMTSFVMAGDVKSIIE